MLRTGLVSATFREKTAEQIVQLAKQAALDSIEWSGDIHVPHGDLPVAEYVRAICEEAEICTPSYASYYRAGSKAQPFEPILRTAKALGAKNIRVWAGEKEPGGADKTYIEKVYKDLREIVFLSKQEGITVSTEYHGGTLTATKEGALNMLAAVDGLYSYWQPIQGRRIEEELRLPQKMGNRLSNIHLFFWRDGKRLPLKQGEDYLKRVLRCADQLNNERFVFLEFVKDDDAQQFLCDAQTLRAWIGGTDV